MSPPRKIYLIRHGRSEADGRFLGQSDPPLSVDGRIEAIRLAVELRGLGLEAVATSPLRRASETARIVAAELGVTAVEDARLSEITYGGWDGLQWEEIERRDPETAQRKLADWWGVTPAGGETAQSFLDRVAAFWTALGSMVQGSVAVVGHAAVNSLLVQLAERKPCAAAWRPDWKRAAAFGQSHGSYIVLPYRLQESAPRVCAAPNPAGAT